MLAKLEIEIEIEIKDKINFPYEYITRRWHYYSSENVLDIHQVRAMATNSRHPAIDPSGSNDQQLNSITRPKQCVIALTGVLTQPYATGSQSVFFVFVGFRFCSSFLSMTIHILGGNSLVKVPSYAVVALSRCTASMTDGFWDSRGG